MEPVHGVDRMGVRERPEGMPIMHQSWCTLLFMHWSLAPELLRPHVPVSLELDTYDGKAWIGVTPFVVRNLRPPLLPPIPWLSDFNEVNVRTYVHHQGVPGVWFFSLDAERLAAVLAARGLFLLPYRYARMSCREEGERISYLSRRADSRQPATLEATWRKGGVIGEAALGTLEFFLTERYCLYASDTRGRLYRARVHHAPWKLRGAELISLRSTMLEAQGLPTVGGEPLLHYSERQDVSVWPLRKASQGVSILQC